MKILTEDGREVCVSCYRFNCWHPSGEKCVTYWCSCTVGNDSEFREKVVDLMDRNGELVRRLAG